MYAVIRTGGKQYRVEKDAVIAVEKLHGEAGDSIAFGEVLMVVADGEPDVGAPLVAGATVTGEVVDQTRGKKIIVFKKKRRQNYRRKKGHRQLTTLVRITEILTGGATPPERARALEAKTAEAAASPAAAASAPAAADAPMFERPAGKSDDLTKISGVGPVIEKKLNALGITTYAQIAAFTPDDLARVDEVLNFKGRIERDDWISQAAKLASGESA